MLQILNGYTVCRIVFPLSVPCLHIGRRYIDKFIPVLERLCTVTRLSKKGIANAGWKCEYRIRCVNRQYEKVDSKLRWNIYRFIEALKIPVEIHILQERAKNVDVYCVLIPTSAMNDE